MKSIYNISLITLLLYSFTLSGFSNNTKGQKLIERVYLQTDKPLYFPGETVWFKGYIVNSDNQLTNISDIVYVELISPKGEITQSLILQIKNGTSFGNFDINKDMPGGMYRVRAYTKWMKNFGTRIYFQKKIIVQKIVKPKLLMTLDFEKESYGRQSEVRAYFECKDLANLPLKNKDINYIININGERNSKKKIKTDHVGKAMIEFQLPDNLNTSDVILNILVPYSGTTETISRSVPVILDNIDLQFFPEGGYLVNHVSNKLAFKALNEFGKPADIEAEIIDENGAVIQRIISYHDGMGATEFKPVKGNRYYAKIIRPFVSERVYSIPSGRDSGLLLSLRKVSNDSVSFNIYAPEKTHITLKAKKNTSVILEKKFRIKKGHNNLNFPTDNMPYGIIEFTLYNETGIPQVERLVFVNKHKGLKISVQPDKSTYAPREQVKLEISTKDHTGKPIPSEISLAVVDDKIISFADDKQDNILSYLLLSSYLKGNIEKPNFYFDPNEEKADSALNLLLMTNGWRSYYTNNNLNFNTAKYKPEQTGIESRTIVDSNNEPVKATVYIIEQNNKQKTAKILTDETGTFSFKKEANKRYIIFAYTKNNKPVFIKKNYIHKEKIKEKENDDHEKIEKEKEGIKKKAIDREENTKNVNSEKDNKTIKLVDNENANKNDGSIILQSSQEEIGEVVVTSLGISREEKSIAYAVVSIDSELINNIDILNAIRGRVAGVEVKNKVSGFSNEVIIRGSNSFSANSSPLYVIDGIPINSANVSEIISTLLPNDIIEVNVLKGNYATSVFGTRAANGAVIIETNHINYYNLNKKIRIGKKINYAYEDLYNYSYQHFSEIKQFYVPIYDSKSDFDIRNDFRQTIYWNPVIQTDETGKAELSFYNSDAITNYRITTEGLSYNGIAGRTEQSYNIQKPLSIDVKLPAYLVTGDTLELPIIISNNTDNTINATLTLDLSIEIEQLNAIPQKITLQPNSGKTYFVKAVPYVETNSSEILIGINGKKYKDMVFKQLEILSPLFPKHISLSGSSDKTFELNLNDQIEEGSLTADFTIYTDVVGDVINGIESILAEPHGCFEQVSSTTYPNVMVLKYLQETGKSNPEIERKAMGYIKRGYFKLAAYETRQNGFEWYGNTPPHEVLSAFGIMQFTEMKEIYSGVDGKMIERTVNWLMERKDGKGGFKQNRGKYGFSAGPVKVNNAYIIYALSESGLDVNIDDEYKFVLTEALKSKDLYRLALTANAAYNFEDIDNYTKLIDLIIEQTDWNNLDKIKAENSITYSWGNSLQVETAALMTLAFLKSKQYMNYVQKLINFIISKRTYNRFGNTQATSLALKSIIEYSKLIKKKFVTDNNSFLLMKVDEKEYKVKLVENNEGLIRVSGIEDILKPGKQTIDIIFKDKSHTMPYTLNVNWETRLPANSDLCPLQLETIITSNTVEYGETARLKITLRNSLNKGIPMSVAKVGIPSGTSVQIWQLEELKEKGIIDFYEVLENNIVLYWREFGPEESKTVRLDLKTEVKGTYTGTAGSAYLYYADENKKWIKGTTVKIK